MDQRTIFTKTAKGLLEASGKTRVLSRDLRNILKEVDGKTTIEQIVQKLEKMPEAKLIEALTKLDGEGFVREFVTAAQTIAPPSRSSADSGGEDLDFTSPAPKQVGKAGEAAKYKADAEQAARHAAATRAKAAAEAKQRAEAEARAKAELEAKRRLEAEAKAKAEIEARQRFEAEAKAKAEIEARQRFEAEAKAKAEIEAKARAGAEAKAKREAEERARRDAEEKARLEAEERARKEAQEKARLEAECKERLEAERRAREEAQRLAREAEERARREAEELRERFEAERRAREELERKAREEAERLAREAQERARREAEEKSRREAEEEARREAGEKSRREAEEKSRREAEEEARREAEERARREAGELRAQLEQERARREAEERGRRETEEKARRETEERARLETEEKARREAEERARLEAEERTRKEAPEKARLEAELNTRLEEERRAREETERRAKEEALAREADERARREAEELRERLEAERRAREELEHRAREEAERKAREDTERKARDEADARRKEEQQREEEDRRRREEKDRKRREEEDRRRREEEEHSRREAEEQARRDAVEAEEKARKKAQQQRAEEEERRRQDEQKREEERRREEERAEVERAAAREVEKQEVEEQSREEAKARARFEAEAAEQARKEARARERALAGEGKRGGAAEAVYTAEPVSEAPRTRLRPPRNWARTIALGLFAVLIVAVAAIHIVPLDVEPFEKAAQDRTGKPVRIGSVNISLLPLPQLRFDKIAIGKEPQVRIASMSVVPEFGSIFGRRKVFRSVQIEGLALPQEMVPAVLWGKGGDDELRVDRVVVKGLKLELGGIALPALEVDAAIGPSGLQKVQLSNGEKGLTVTLQADGDKTRIEISAQRFALPFAPEIELDEFSAKGTVGAQEISFSEVEARAFDGVLLGNARLSWRQGWSIEGEIAAKQMDAAKLAAPILAKGRLEGKGVYGMKAATPDKLLAAARLEGNVSIQKGEIANINLTRVLQGASSAGGSTLFSEMSGSVVAEANRFQLRQLRLAAGLLSASGGADVDAQKNLSGRMQVELRAQTTQVRATLAISGTLKEPQFRRSN